MRTRCSSLTTLNIATVVIISCVIGLGPSLIQYMMYDVAIVLSMVHPK